MKRKSAQQSLLSPSDWLDLRFPRAKRRPHVNTVRRWIASGELPGRKIGGSYFVDVEREQTTTGDSVVDRILNDDTKAA